MVQELRLVYSVRVRQASKDDPGERDEAVRSSDRVTTRIKILRRSQSIATAPCYLSSGWRPLKRSANDGVSRSSGRNFGNTSSQEVVAGRTVIARIFSIVSAWRRWTFFLDSIRSFSPEVVPENVHSLRVLTIQTKKVLRRCGSLRNASRPMPLLEESFPAKPSTNRFQSGQDWKSFPRVS